MKKIVVVRQRPSIGDCLLLGPLLKEIKRKYGGTTTVITDSSYMGGALVTIFEGMGEFVDRVESVSSWDWTTESNLQIDPSLGQAAGPMPPTIKKADHVFDCNGGFMLYERGYGGHTPLGISEFWLDHFDFDHTRIDPRPYFEVNPEIQALADQWIAEFNPTNKPIVGMVLRAGDSARDWNIDDKAMAICDWLHTSGYVPVSFDPVQKSGSVYAQACIGRKIDFVAAVIKRCTLVVTPDTGLLHLAEALRVKTVSLWGIIRPEVRVKGYNTMIIPPTSLGFCDRQDRNCRCSWKFQQWSCLRRITLNMIYNGIKEALST